MKRITILLAAGLFISALNAQNSDQYRHEIGISVGGGLSSLQYKLTEGKHGIGFGGQAGVGYTFFFSPHWGLGTGAEIAVYQAKAKLSDFSDSYDVQGATAADNYTYSYTLNNYSELQRALYINIPLIVQYQTGGKHKFFAALGGKVGFPINAVAQTDNCSVSTKGYFPAEGRTYDDLPQFGFGTFNYAGSKTNLDKLNINLMASAELGVKWKICGKTALYTGIYADYGFYNIQKTNSKTFIQSTLTADNPPMSPVVESQFAGKPFTDKITPLAVGLKIKFAFGLGKNFQKSAAPTEKEVTTPEKEVVPPPTVVDNSAAEKAKADIAQAQEAQRVAAEKAKQEAQLQAAKAEINQPIKNYTLSQTELTDAQKQELDVKIALLQQNPDLNCFIYGHTCDIGGDKINEKVGLQRAQKAKEYMLSKGIAESRILGIASKRDTEPLVPNTSEANRKQNRRVEIVVVQ